jgi:uncharacterized protein
MIVPEPDVESGPYWRGLAERRIVLQACPSCRRHRFPRLPSCPWCGTDGAVDVDVSGTGTVYSWVGVERALTEVMSDQVPYCVVTVDLDGGGRLQGRLESPAAARIGLPVGPVFVDHDGWTELRFAPLGEPE